MDYSTYNLEIQDCINKILETYDVDVDLTLSCCERLLAYGSQTQDSFLLGFAYYYMGESYYYLENHEKQLFSLFKALEYLEDSKSWDLLARSYNLLGILSGAQGNPSSAIDYYLEGLNVCSVHELSYVAGMISSNIALIFAMVHDYSQSLVYLKQSVEHFFTAQKQENQDCAKNLCISYISMGECHLYLGSLEEAKHYMKETEKLLPLIPADYIGISAFVFEAMLAHTLGDFEGRDICIQKILDLSMHEYSLLTFYDDFLNISSFLLEIGEYDILLQILNVMETMAVQAENLYIQIEITKIRLSYYKQSNQNSMFLNAASHFYELTMKQDAAKQKITASTIELRFSLNQMQNKQKLMEQENQRLTIKSESDALTGLPNRYKMNDYSELLLTKALNNQVPFSVEILDIDFFKQYNDTYGHQRGDTCLVAVAGELAAMADEDIFCARYGGDEFIILYYNKTVEEVRALCESLQERIWNLHLEHKASPSLPYVTITQGVIHRIPAPGNRMWDFLHAADNALYEGKKLGRNSITIKT